MKTMLLALAAPGLALPSLAETRTYDAPETLSAVSVRGPYAVEITRGDSVSVVAEGREAALSHMRVEASGQSLSISQRCFVVCTSNGRRATVRVMAPSLEALSVAMGAEATARDVAAQRISISASMGGVVEVAGPCDALEVSASMGGVVHADALMCRDVAASASMGGVVGVAASEALTASSSMGGEIVVEGGPTRREIRTSMGGAVSFD
jgi:hypothetical protein